MLKKVLFGILVAMILALTVFAGPEKIFSIDVTGDNIPEKIYGVFKDPGGQTSGVFYKLVVEQKVGTRTRDIFPVMMDETSYIYFSSRGGYGIGVFDSRYPGKQIVIYNGSGGRSEITGYFYKKEPNDDKFKLYRMDVTDNQYWFVGSGGKNPPDCKNQVLKEFHGKTKFTRAHERAQEFIDALRRRQYDRAASMALGEEPGCMIEEYKKHPNKDNFEGIRINSYDAKINKEIVRGDLQVTGYTFYGHKPGEGKDRTYIICLCYDGGRLVVGLIIHEDPKKIFPADR